jgi:hypothetical protein
MYKIVAVIITGVYFCRLKIYHDTHEIILDSGTIVNTNNLLSLLKAEVHVPGINNTIRACLINGGECMTTNSSSLRHITIRSKMMTHSCNILTSSSTLNRSWTGLPTSSQVHTQIKSLIAW